METIPPKINIQASQIFKRDPSPSTLSPSLKISSKKFPSLKRRHYPMKNPIFLRHVAKQIAGKVKSMRNNAASGIRVLLNEAQISLIQDLTHFSEYKYITTGNNIKIKSLLRGSLKYFDKSLRDIFIKLTWFRSIYNFIEYFISKLCSICRVIKPNSKFKLFWDGFGSILSILSIILTSLSFSLDIRLENMLDVAEFNFEGKNSILYPCVSFAFLFYLLNIWINFNLAYHEVGDLIVNKRLIARHYFKNAFLLDLISIIPFVIATFTDSLNLPMDNTSLLVFFKLKSINEFIVKIESVVSSDELTEAIFSLVFLVLSVLLINHCIACFWCLLATNQYGDSSERNWSIVLKLDKRNEYYWMQLYLKSYYWSLTTIVTLGYGDIVPQNNVETGVSMLVMLTGSAIFGFTINKIGIILENINRRNRALRKNIKIVNIYMKRKSLPLELQSRVRKYLEFSFKEETIPDIQAEQIFTQRLSSSLNTEVKSKIYGDILQSLPMLKSNFKNETLRNLTLHLKTAHFRPGEIIMEKNQANNKNLYIINEGQAFMELMEKKYSSKKGNASKSIVMERGSSFGEYSFFTDMQSLETIRSLSYSTVSFVNREDFINVLQENRFEYEKFCEIRDRLLLNDYRDLSRICPFCNKTGHPIDFCGTLKYIPNVQNVIARYLWSPVQERTVKFKRCKKRDFLDPLSNKEANMTGCYQVLTTMELGEEAPSLSVVNEDGVSVISEVDEYEKSGSIEMKLSTEVKKENDLNEENSSDRFNKEIYNMDIPIEQTFLEVPIMKAEGVSDLKKNISKHSKIKRERSKSKELQVLDLVHSTSRTNNNLDLGVEQKSDSKEVKNDNRFFYKKSKTILAENPMIKSKEVELEQAQPVEVIDFGKLDEVFSRKIEGDLFNFSMDFVHTTSNYMVEYNIENTVIKARRALQRVNRKKTRLKTNK